MDESAGMILDSDDRITSGSHGEYQWLISTAHYIGILIKRTPEVVLNRYLAVTSIDSGTPRLTAAQERAGWQSRQGIAYGPKIQSTENLLDYQVHGDNAPGFDEWYVFTEPRDLGVIHTAHPMVEEFTPRPGHIVVFVNYYEFVMDREDPLNRVFVDLLWKQLEWIQPESYIADCDKCLAFITKNRDFFETVHETLKRDYVEGQVAEPKK
jgi:hypothetical protein